MDIPEGIQRLREQFPDYAFGTVWTAAASGPDAWRIWAMRDGSCCRP